MSAQTDARAARHALDRLLTAHPFELPDGFGDAVERYVELLLAANARLNLTRVVQPDAIARLHLLDALAALPIVDELAPADVLDLGSGGGVPGMVLALARPGIRWTLVESVRKKASELEGFVAELGIANAEVLAERAEILGRDRHRRETSDLVTARACAALPVVLEYGLPLLRVGGAILAWKGPIATDELGAGAVASGLLGGGEPEVRPTGLDALGDHRFVLARKIAPTPERYPRRAGEPARRPLG